MTRLTQKQCSICSQHLPLTGFNRRSRSRDGYRSECRNCQQASSALYHDKNRKIKRNNSKKWYAQNLDRARLQFRRYRENNLEKCKLLQKDWYARRWIRQRICKIVQYLGYKISDQSVSIQVLNAALMQSFEDNCGLCPRTGAPLIFGQNTHLDHKIPRSRAPELALSFDNLQIVSDVYNRAKGTMTDEEFARHWRLEYIP